MGYLPPVDPRQWQLSPPVDESADEDDLTETIRTHRYREQDLDGLHDLLRLVGTGSGSSLAYVLIPPPQETGIRKLSNWRRIVWRTDASDGNSTHPAVPIVFRRAIISRNHRGTRDRRNVIFSDEDAEVLVALPGPGGELLGYLGVGYPDGERPSLRAIRLLQDIVCNHLRSVRNASNGKSGGTYWQKVLDEKGVPSLIVTADRIAYVNDEGVHMLGAQGKESVCSSAIDDFISAEESGRVHAHLRSVLNGDSQGPLECTIVGLDGSRRRVQGMCKRIVCHGVPSVELVLEPVSKYRNYPDPLIETISEAVWHVVLHTPVPTTSTPANQSRLIRRGGALAESNRTLAEYLGAKSVEDFLGRTVGSLIPGGGKTLIDAFIHSGYNLRRFELRIRDSQGDVRLFSINAMGTIENGFLTHIWGSCSEISERLEFEKMSVSLQEEQKKKIGRDLHDSVAPLLTGMRLLSGDIIQNPDSDQASLKNKVEKLASFAEQATYRLREIYRGLVPRMLEEHTLAEALEELARNVNDLPGVTVRFSSGPDADVDRKESKTHLYRIVQEAINNALKHASPAQIEISLRRKQGRLLLEIRDDGKGFDANATTRDSLGLENMKLRADTVGGALSISSTPGRGTTVSVSLRE